MFGCIITGSLCSTVSVLSCVAACYVVADCQLWYEIKELLLLLLFLFQRVSLCPLCVLMTNNHTATIYVAMRALCSLPVWCIHMNFTFLGLSK